MVESVNLPYFRTFLRIPWVKSITVEISVVNALGTETPIVGLLRLSVWFSHNVAIGRLTRAFNRGPRVSRDHKLYCRFWEQFATYSYSHNTGFYSFKRWLYESDP